MTKSNKIIENKTWHLLISANESICGKSNKPNQKEEDFVYLTELINTANCIDCFRKHCKNMKYEIEAMKTEQKQEFWNRLDRINRGCQ